MNQQAKDAITGMLNCFPQTNQDYRVLLLTLSKLLDGVADQAVIRAAERYASGDVTNQSMTFAPSGPEFVAEVRRVQEVLDIQAKPRLPAPVYRRGLMAPFEMMRQKALAENSHLPVLFEGVSYEQFRKMSASRDIPVGAKWVACLATVFGPSALATSARAS